MATVVTPQTFNAPALGAEVTLTAQFSDLNSDTAPLDPATVTLRLLKPVSNAVVPLTYANGDLTRLAKGSFSYSLVLGEAGTWAVRWEGGGGDIVGTAPAVLYIVVPSDPFYPGGVWS